MARPRTKDQRALDQQQVAEFRHRGFTQCQIAERLGLAQSTVSAYCKRNRKAALQRAEMDTLDILAEALSFIDFLQKEGFEGWFRSKEDAIKTVKSVEKGGSHDQKQSARTEAIGQVGDPHFLRVLLDVQERRLDLLGMYDLLLGEGDDEANSAYLAKRRRADQLLKDDDFAQAIEELTQEITARATQTG